jgi:multiple antibiotic resistance protein
MRVILTHHVADDARRLAYLLVPVVAALMHGIENAAVHRLEAVAHIRQRPADDHAHGVIEIVVAGQSVLNVLGISVSAFRVAGGILLFLIALEMVFGKRQQRKSETAEKAVESVEAHQGTIHEIAVFPLAIPLIAGPAAISAIILLSGQAPDTVAYAGLGAVIIVILVSCLLAFLLAERIERLLGDTAQLVITRLLGVLLAALSVQFVADGILAFLA